MTPPSFSFRVCRARAFPALRAGVLASLCARWRVRGDERGECPAMSTAVRWWRCLRVVSAAFMAAAWSRVRRLLFWGLLLRKRDRCVRRVGGRAFVPCRSFGPRCVPGLQPNCVPDWVRCSGATAAVCGPRRRAPGRSLRGTGRRKHDRAPRLSSQLRSGALIAVSSNSAFFFRRVHAACVLGGRPSFFSALRPPLPAPLLSLSVVRLRGAEEAGAKDEAWQPCSASCAARVRGPDGLLPLGPTRHGWAGMARLGVAGAHGARRPCGASNELLRGVHTAHAVRSAPTRRQSARARLALPLGALLCACRNEQRAGRKILFFTWSLCGYEAAFALHRLFLRVASAVRE
ncbi:uncharacterized protein Tco025E_08339 [Trypanosoma conorhini]|uniref:Uncharacterized protein n=1 Tax=Trypanosoma conorhini TaxID=83891 RepID=A0A3S5IQW8_9TRYP|nr:uncharacterized protein Tco025E_08339 [Trypanosoma conorhini]RNF02867.1 hypothetical protein Tco025E_08339 [Trypanosoma conorhini]